MAGKWIIVAAFLLSTASFSQAAAYYVSTTGSDENAGTLHAPFATFQKASDMARAGDQVLVLSGTYCQKVVIRAKGTKEKPVLVKALGQVVILSPADVSLGQTNLKIGDSQFPISSPKHLYHPYYLGAVIRIEDCEYLTLDGFAVGNSPWFGIAGLHGKHITVQNCFTADTGASGIYMLNSENVRVVMNEVTRACSYPKRIGGHGTQEMISLVNCTHFEIAHNQVHEPGTYSRLEGGGSGTGGEGIDAKEGSSHGSIHHNYVYNLSRLGIYLDAWNAHNFREVEIYNNVVHDASSGISVAAEDGGTVDGVRIYNNLIYNCSGTGLYLASWGPNGIKKNVDIYNNTFYNCERGAIGLGDERNQNITIYNNLAWKCGKGDQKCLDAGKAKNVREGGNRFQEDPKFADIKTSNFHLLADSPAIDAAVDFKTPDDDGDGKCRVSGKAMDAGAFEYQHKEDTDRSSTK
jgi:hypothetical protein